MMVGPDFSKHKITGECHAGFVCIQNVNEMWAYLHSFLVRHRHNFTHGSRAEERFLLSFLQKESMTIFISALFIIQYSGIPLVRPTLLHQKSGLLRGVAASCQG